MSARPCSRTGSALAVRTGGCTGGGVGTGRDRGTGGFTTSLALTASGRDAVGASSTCATTVAKGAATCGTAIRSTARADGTAGSTTGTAGEMAGATAVPAVAATGRGTATGSGTAAAWTIAVGASAGTAACTGATGAWSGAAGAGPALAAGAPPVDADRGARTDSDNASDRAPAPDDGAGGFQATPTMTAACRPNAAAPARVQCRLPISITGGPRRSTTGSARRRPPGEFGAHRPRAPPRRRRLP